MNERPDPESEPAPEPELVILRKRQPRASGRKGLPTTPTVYPALSLGDILHSLRHGDGVYMTGFPGFDGRHKLSDLLGHQVRTRRVRRVGRGRYEAIPEAISRTNHWRIANWERFAWHELDTPCRSPSTRLRYD